MAIGRDEASGRIGTLLDVAEGILWLVLVSLALVVALELHEQSGEAEQQREASLELTGRLIEAEALRVRATSPGFTFWRQPTTDFAAGGWSGGAHMLASRAELGDWVELELPRVAPARYGLEMHLTRAVDYGIVAVTADGERLGGDIDLWSKEGVRPTGPVHLGVVEIGAEPLILRVTVVGRNPRTSPPHHQFGIDAVRLSVAKTPREES